MTSTNSRAFALLFLRIALGFLFIWWGLARGLNTGVGKAVSDNFYGGWFSAAAISVTYGWAQVVVGLLIVAGLFQRILMPLFVAINLFTLVTVWYAIVDPFGLWLPKQTDFPFAQLFYPSIIIVAAGLVSIAFRAEDRFRLGRSGVQPELR